MIDPRGVLLEFGTELAEDIEVRVWDSTAEERYLVLPEPRGNGRLKRGCAGGPSDAGLDDWRGQGCGAGRRQSVNGVHDMGGMQDFGPIVPEKNEPVFHARWEARLVAMRRVLAAAGKLPPTFRPATESLLAGDYLSMSYYEK